MKNGAVVCCDLLEKKQFDGRLAKIGCAAHEPDLDAAHKNYVEWTKQMFF
jgi:hypothetical protein